MDFPLSRRRFNAVPLAIGLTSLQGTACAREATRAQVPVDVDLSDTVARSPSPMLGFGGNIWLTPGAFEVGVAERILNMPRLGMTRVSLGDQLLEQANSLADLKRRLENFALNTFLREFRRKGGRVMLILDGTPSWLSSSKSSVRLKNPNQPTYRVNPAEDLAGWADVVEVLVRHFNGTLGLDAWYEAWNEPNLYYVGTFDQFMAQYRASVLGARRADARARVGGPGIAHFNGVGTGKALESDAEKLTAVGQTLEQDYMFRRFLKAAASMSVPELKLARLPVDFFSWHGFYLDPSKVYPVVTPFIRDSLAAAGYPRDTPIVTSEWNLAAVPPYPEGDLNATHVGGAYAAASVLAMQAAGIDHQVFQMFVDPGVDGYSGGLWTTHGLARANCNAMRLLSMLSGRQVKARSSDEWVQSVAFQDGRTVNILVVASTPTGEMLKNTENVLGPLRNADFMRLLAREGLAERLLRGAALPTTYASEAQQRQQSDANQLKTYAERVSQRTGSTIDLRLSVRGLGKLPPRATYWLIDSRHGNIAPEVAGVAASLRAEQQSLSRISDDIRQALVRDGISESSAADVVSALKAGRSLDDAVSRLDPSRRADARARIEGLVSAASSRVRRILTQAESTPQASLSGRDIDWPANGILEVSIEPNSVHLFTLTLGA